MPGIKGGVAGLVIQPAVWVATGSGPDAGDAFIYSTGVVGAFVGAIVAVPAILTGVVKAAVDDHTGMLVAEAKKDELARYRNGIYAIGDYSFMASGGHIQAMAIAGAGGVVWQHPNGVHLFIKDATGRLVCDFQPKRYTKIYAPLLPLQRVGNGVRWTQRFNSK
ncbi:MAG: hypothetical protein P8J27_07850 [Mariniblastus sp.]|nr:hypothetical protein [Mariniblastus sp.]